MTIHLRSSLGGALFSLLLLPFSTHADDQVRLRLNPNGVPGVLEVESHFSLPVSSMYPEHTLQYSTDLKTWTNAAEPVAGGVGVSDEIMKVAVPLGDDHGFYRVASTVKLDVAAENIGDAVFGFSTEFRTQLDRLGQIRLAEFLELYSLTNQYLPQISFDPTTADFWDQFNIDPAAYNATSSWPNYRARDFRLSPQEFSVFEKNGFVVSPRMGRESFADIYYDIYTDDLPVFVTTDSVLHAWHRTVVTMLEEIEQTRLAPQIGDILDGMASQVGNLWAQASGSAIAEGVLDADYFLAVARSLADGTYRPGALGQGSRVNLTLLAINSLQPAKIDLYGEPRTVDFSQFQVRGHYANSQTLERYFRTMMWCALADFRYAGFSTGVAAHGATNALRELSGAVALNFLLQNAGQFDGWLELNRVLEQFVGTPDSLTFAQLNDLLHSADIQSPADLATETALTNLQTQLMSGQLGLQQVTSGYYWSPLGAEQTKLPRSFSMLGQRFVPDSWALGKCTFDDIIWDTDGIPSVSDKVLRRVPSALDVAFAVLGNSQIVPEIAARMRNRRGHRWRDGLPYQHNLAAVRNTVDAQEPEAWTNSVYLHWLACLRELSAPTTDARFPEAMRTRAWALKTLNTQLASWTQLRHDTVLYAEQSYTPILLCSYPDGYVEPQPGFWARMEQMAQATRAVLETLPTNGVFNYVQYDTNEQPYLVTVTGQTMHSNRVHVMEHFAQTTDMLRGISEKEIERLPLSAEETAFLRTIVELNYFGERTYTGWYPDLFYEPASEYIPPSPYVRPDRDDKGSDFWDALVTDVHTDPPDPLVGDRGSILHEAVGNVHLVMVAVDCGPTDLAVYAGPVLSHYEFELDAQTRLTDAEWRTNVSSGILPPQPSWTESYLVPSP